jgi:hypothetical protein
VQHGRIRAAVEGRDPHQHVVERRPGVLDQDVEVTVLVEGAGVGQLELGLVPATAAVLLAQAGVRELGLRILVEGLEVGAGGGGVEVEVALLDVLAVVALGVGESEKAFLEDRILAVPQGHGEAQPALVIAQAQEAVLAPAVGPAAGVVVGQVAPGVAVGGVVLAHRPPLALRQVRSPALPVAQPAGVLRQAATLGVSIRFGWHGWVTDLLGKGLAVGGNSSNSIANRPTSGGLRQVPR